MPKDEKPKQEAGQDNQDAILPFEVFRPALGYLLVAFVCYWAGWRLSPDGQSFFECVTECGLFLSLIFPYFINHAICYDKKFILEAKESSKIYLWHKKAGVEYAKFFFIYGLFVFVIACFASNPTSLSEAPLFRETPLRLIISVLPFGLVVYWREKKREAESDKIFYFRFRSIFPAIITCFVPFMLAWSGPVALSPLVGVVVLLWLCWDILHRKGKYLIVLVSTILVMFLFAAPLYFPKESWLSEFARISFVGIMMTLVMGVAESFKVTTRVIAGLEVVPETGSVLSNPEFYTLGTNIAATVLPPVFLLSFLHEGTTFIWLLGTALLSLIMLTLWLGELKVLKRKDYKKWWKWSIIFGFVIPFLVIGGWFSWEPKDTWVTDNNGYFFLAFLGFIIAMLSMNEKIRHPLKLLIKRDTSILLKASGCLTLLCLLSCFFAAVLLIVRLAAVDSWKDRINTLVIVYSLIAFVSMGCWWIMCLLRDDEGRQNSIDNLDSHNDSNLSNRRSQLACLWQSARPSTSVIAGILSTAIVVRASSTGIIETLLRCLPIVGVTMAGFIFNDLHDREKDRIGGKDRPIAQGHLKPFNAWIGTIALTVLSFSMEWILGSSTSATVIATVILGVIIYSPFAKRMPIAKGLYTSVLTCSPIVYGCVVGSTSIPIAAYVVLVVFMVGRELLADVRDIDEDQAVGIRTLAYYLGKPLSLSIGWKTMWLGVLGLTLIVPFSSGFIFIVPMLLLLALSKFISVCVKETEFIFSRLAMLFGALALSGLAG